MAKKTWMTRAAGVLLPVSSLPSKYGVGTFGQAAREWVDFLARAKQRYWQVLPLGPTSFGDSPYQSFCFCWQPAFYRPAGAVQRRAFEKRPLQAHPLGGRPLLCGL